MQYEVSFGTDIAQCQCFLIGELGKIFQSNSVPAKGRTFRSGITVSLLVSVSLFCVSYYL
jgi:hypothetical protein